MALNNAGRGASAAKAARMSFLAGKRRQQSGAQKQAALLIISWRRQRMAWHHGMKRSGSISGNNRKAISVWRHVVTYIVAATRRLSVMAP